MLAVLAVSLGAALGALLRWRLGVWLNTTAAGAAPWMPWGTLSANLIGGYLVGVFLALFQALPELDPVWRLAIITGFMGGLTTFSSFSAEVVTMMQQQRFGLALITAATHLGGSLVLTYVGIRTTMLLLPR